MISPKIGGEVSVRLSKGAESCFKEVSLRTRMAAGLGVTIAKSRELQKFLWGHGRDDSGTTGRGNETHSNTSAFTGKLTQLTKCYIQKHEFPFATSKEIQQYV